MAVAAPELVEYFSLSLPPEDLQKHPQLTSLLRDLQSKYAQQGWTHEEEQELQQLEDNLLKEKAKFLEVSFLCDALTDTVQAAKAKPQIANNAKKMEVYSNLDRLLAVAESSQCLPLVRDQENTNPQTVFHTGYHTDPSCQADAGDLLFGLSQKEFLDSTLDCSDVEQQVDTIHHTVLPQVEQELMAKCELLHEFYGLPSDPLSAGAPSSAARPMWKLPDVVSTDMQKLRQQQQQERRLREDIQCQIRAYFQTLCDTEELLIDVVANYKLQHQYQADKASKEELRAKLLAYGYKLRAMKREIELDTYTRDTIPALRKIAYALSARLKEASQTLKSLQTTAQQYDNVGMDFPQLVEEYAKLQSEIERRQWTLDQMSGPPAQL